MKSQEFKCEHSDVLDVKILKEHPKNANKHSLDQVDRLAKIISHQGFRSPIVISRRSGFIVAGHGRLLAAKKLGIKFVPVDYQDFDSDEDEYAHLVADNSIAAWAEIDLSQVKSEVPELGEFDYDLLGFKEFELDADDLGSDADPDAIPEAPKVAKSKLGDLYTLGNHRLLCGDSTDKATVERLMNGEKADMVFTDPPYGMSLDTDYSKMPSTKKEGNKKYSKVIGDNDDFTPKLIETIFDNFGDCHECFIFGADYFSEHLVDKNLGSWVVWDKRVTENFDAMIGSAFELCWSKAKHKREIARFNNTLFGGDKESRNKSHPTQKPTAMIQWFLDKWGKQNDLVADIYGGSGSTLIACEKTNRKCFMMELDPIYIDVILTRWAEFTGLDPVREDGVTWSSLNPEEFDA